MKTLVLLAALAALTSAQFKPYNPISVDIQGPAPVNIQNAAPTARPIPRPAPRPVSRAPPPPPPPPAPVVVSTTLAPGGDGGAGGLFGGDGFGAGGPGSGLGGGFGSGLGGGGSGLGGGGFGAGGAGNGNGRFGAGGAGGFGPGGAGFGAPRGPPPPPPPPATSLRNGQGSAAARNAQGNHWVILRQSNDVGQTGYLWDIETENGIGAREQGQLANPGTDAEAMQAQGYYEWTGPDGILYRVDYTANEDGFQASGAHLPTPPPIPEAIQRALAYIAANPPPPENDSRISGRFAKRK